MSNFTNSTRNTMNQFSSNNFRTKTNEHYQNSQLFELLILVGAFITVLITTIGNTIMDKFDKRPVLPFTTYDTCSSSSISTSPTSNNVIRRTNSSESIVISM